MSLDTNHKIKLFNDTLINIFSNFCPYKTIVCNDNEPPCLVRKYIAFIRYQNISTTQCETKTFKILVDQLAE